MGKTIRCALVSVGLAASGAVVMAACGSGPASGVEGTGRQSAAITCSPTCGAWSECESVTIKNTPTTECVACGQQGEAPCVSGSGPDAGCAPQAGATLSGLLLPGAPAYPELSYTGVTMGQKGGVCEDCGDLNQPACDATWQPPPSVYVTWYHGCNLTSQLYFPQPLQPSGGTCAPCGWANEPACNTGNGPQCYMGGFTPVGGNCVPCGTVGMQACAAPDDACVEGLSSVGGVCTNNYSSGYPYQAFTLAYVPDVDNGLLSNPRVVTIVASNDTPGADGTDTAASLHGFGDVVGKSAMWSGVTNEYGLGTLTSAGHLTGPSLTGNQTMASLRAYLSTVANLPAPNNGTVYLLYIPTGATLDATEFGGSCGFHFWYQSNSTDNVAVVKRCTGQGPESQLDAMTRDASHEIVESASNPRGRGYNFGVNYSTTTPVPIFEGTREPGGIWTAWNAGDVEIGDQCEGTREIETLTSPLTSNTSWEMQRMFSNAASWRGGDPCIPAAADPYFSVSIPQGWYPIQANGTVQIPVIGWSVSQTSGTWYINHSQHAQAGGADCGGTGQPACTLAVTSLTSPLGNQTPPGCGLRAVMQNGTAATLTVSATGAQSGDYMVVQVESFREVASCNPLLTTDQTHFWPVGVYVP